MQIFLIAMIAFSLPRTFGKMVGNTKQGLAIVSVMGVIAAFSVTLLMFFQLQAHGTVPTAVGSATEGVETRFGVADSAVFAATTTLTSTGAVNSFHDSYTSLGGLMTMFNMQLGEVAPGGVGSGLYGMLILAIITVFVAGLMVGRTPEYLGKKITPREIKLAASYFLVTPLLVLTGTSIAMAMPEQRDSMLNTGPHGLGGVVRLHFRGQQQRLGVRRHQRQHPVVQHRARLGDAAGTFPAADPGAGVGGIAGPPGQHTGLGRHLADTPSAVRRDGVRCDRDPGRVDLPAHARAGPTG